WEGQLPGCGPLRGFRHDGRVGRRGWWLSGSWRGRPGGGVGARGGAPVCVGRPGGGPAGPGPNQGGGGGDHPAPPVTPPRAGVGGVGGGGGGGVGGGRGGAPPLDRMVQRPELAHHLVTALTAPGPAEVGLTTALHGAGGFGKTHLATWACHHPQINRRYPGGL